MNGRYAKSSLEKNLSGSLIACARSWSSSPQKLGRVKYRAQQPQEKSEKKILPCREKEFFEIHDV